jgi:hypothetical protein
MKHIIFGLLVFILIILASQIWNTKEGMVDTIPIPDSDVIPYGHYRIDADNMAKLPYGYEVDTSDPTMKKIIPVTNTNFYKAKPVKIPVSGVPDGHYKVSDGFMSVLPPNMKADIKAVNPDGSFVYNVGYINEQEFYDRRFPLPKNENGKPLIQLPSGTYLNDDKKTISVLSYGKIANGLDTPGYIDNPNLISATGRFTGDDISYKDIQNNYDVEFHESADKLIEDQSVFTDASFGAITVLNASGEYVVLPRSNVEGTITYLKPGSFKYTPSNYVPNYEDSIFLSRTTHLPTISFYTPSDIKKGFCELYKDNKDKLEENCQQLKPDACASSSCCVLLGGSKCVSGNTSGPLDRANYSDVYIRNKDFYYYQGKCYGNCV